MNKNSTSDHFEILRKIEDSRRPTLIVGSLGIRLDISEEIHEIRVPIFSTLAAKGVLDERTDYSAGVYTGAASPNLPEQTVLQESDLIIGIGLRSSEILKFPIQVEKIINLELPGLEHKLTGNWETTLRELLSVGGISPDDDRQMAFLTVLAPDIVEDLMLDMCSWGGDAGDRGRSYLLSASAYPGVSGPGGGGPRQTVTHVFPASGKFAGQNAHIHTIALAQ